MADRGRVPRINGAPVRTGEGWVILRREHDARSWSPLEFTMARTRREAIRKVDEIVAPGWYEAHRRRGEVIAVHCIVQPVCLPETAGEADRRVIVDLGPLPPESVLHVTDAGDRKISVIKAIREHAHLGLKEARDVSEGWRFDVPHADSRAALSAALDELGASYRWVGTPSNQRRSSPETER